jgi:predicted cupin superfamily sugar epimerase
MRAVEADAVIARLELVRHPEGGWYRETFRDAPAGGGRGNLAHILYLLKSGERSRWHRIDAIEIWHYSLGAPLTLSVAALGEPVRQLILGGDAFGGELPHAVVPAGAWQSARSLGAFTLVGCSTAPAFRFEGFELAADGWEP